MKFRLYCESSTPFTGGHGFRAFTKAVEWPTIPVKGAMIAISSNGIDFEADVNGVLYEEVDGRLRITVYCGSCGSTAEELLSLGWDPA